MAKLDSKPEKPTIYKFSDDAEYVVNGIKYMDFRILSTEEIQRHSVLKVSQTNAYEGNVDNPTKYGLLDRRLGVGNKFSKCDTCFKDCKNCVGHFGSIELAYPVYHVGYFNYTIQILQSICKRCSRVMLDESQRHKYILKLSEDLTPLAKKFLHKEILALCKKAKNCPFCGFKNGTIKKIAFLKIFHMISAKDTPIINKIFEHFKGNFEDIQAYFGNSLEFLSPYNVLKLFEKIPKCDYIFLMLFHNTPMDLICRYLPVPPCIIRPSTLNSNGRESNEDELTQKLSEILNVNDSIRKRLQEGAVLVQVMDAWDTLQVLVAVHFNSHVRNLPPQHSQMGTGMGIAQRLKGKEGRFRANLSGKRVNFSARTVISPDPNLGIDEVGIPRNIAMNMTYPERVTPINMEFMKQLVINGPKVYPGAMFIFSGKDDSFKKHLNFANRKQVADNLKIGDKVLRHMINGDYVLFNRQPSLHRLSIMCHKVRVHPDNTFKFNECVCNPYNADFDGDEMNVHFLQLEEAKAEGAVLMQSKYNIPSPRNGEPVIAPIQDFLTAIYLLTQRGTFFNQFEFSQIVSNLMINRDSGKTLRFPPPVILKPYRLWTGKQLLNIVLRPYVESVIDLNLNFPTKAYSGSNQELCESDGYVRIRNSEILCGTLDKSLIGGGSKKNIFYLILTEYGSDEAIAAMLRLCRVTSFFMSNLGFSIGIDDVTPTIRLLNEKAKLVEKGYHAVQAYIQQFFKGKLQPITGCSMEATLEQLILKELSEIRDHAGKACIKALTRNNSPLVMANSGSKGSYINVSQMAVCVGQQAIRGNRVTDGFSDRVLPHFDFQDKSPMAKGFVENSFFSGLNPYEFFFHAMAGREGLLDTAVKTAETGYMQRRLVKGLEDLVVHYDHSVRNSSGEIIQFRYGSDGVDPMNIEHSGLFMDLNYHWNDTLIKYSRASQSIFSTGAQMRKLVYPLVKDNKVLPENYKKTILRYLFKKSYELDDQIQDFRYNLKELGNIPADIKQKLETTITIYSEEQVKAFFRKVQQKYIGARINPGTAIGAICAQSIGEPTTQMTLKTFHFTGVASMNITQGVPRITEIINATKNPSTPFMRVELENPNSAEEAERVKWRIENIFLDQICSKIVRTDYNDQLCFMLVIDEKLYSRIGITTDFLHSQIMAQIKPASCVIDFPYVLITPSIQRMVYLLDVFEEELSKVYVSGNKKVTQVTLCEEKGKYHLMVQGNGFLEVLGTRGVNFEVKDNKRRYKSRSNNIHEVAAVLGIEAARRCIIDEIKTTIQSHGITIDERHLMMLADTMTASGNIVGMTRAGFSKVKTSTIKMASFEQTVDYLYQSSYYNNNDNLLGASESIIVGAPTRMGTGFFDVVPKLETRNIDFKQFDHKLSWNGIDF